MLEEELVFDPTEECDGDSEDEPDEVLDQLGIEEPVGRLVSDDELVYVDECVDELDSEDE